MICTGENGSLNHIGALSNTIINTLSKAKNRAIPWYLPCLIERNHEKSIMKIVPGIRRKRFM
jgi:hypothetical protein